MILKCKMKNGDEVLLTMKNFSTVDFEGVEIISGEKYYIDKAVKLGAKKPAVKRKAK